jgi:hypothetical protein
VLYEADASVGEKDAELYAAVEEGDEALNAWFKTFWEGARKARERTPKMPIMRGWTRQASGF